MLRLKNLFQKPFVISLLTAAAFASVLITAGCGSKNFTLSMASLPNVNPDSTGRPSPVLVKMYELKSDLVFKQSEMTQLFSDPVNTLGADLIAYDEITMVPGEARENVYEPAADTGFIGVVASFRFPDTGIWKVVKSINPEKKSKIALELNGSNLILIADDKAKKWDPVEAVNDYNEHAKGVSKASSLSNKPPATGTYSEPLSQSPQIPALPSVGEAPSLADQPWSASPRPMKKIK